MIQPEIWHILFSIAGLVLGWYLKHQSIKVPPEVLAAIEQLLAQKLQHQGRNLLQDLLEAAKGPLSAPKP